MKSIQVDFLKDIQKVWFFEIIYLLKILIILGWFLKQWLQTISGKQALYHSLAEYHRSIHEENEKNIGIQVSRLAVSYLKSFFSFLNYFFNLHRKHLN
jgi:hypothetical protein